MSFLQPRVRTGIVIWLVATMPLLLVPAGCVSFEDLARTGSAAPASDRCGDCHSAAFEEWRESPHARAFVSETFLAHTDGGRIESCLPCHAPGSLPDGPERPTVARQDRLDEGVHCLACHRLTPDHGVSDLRSGDSHGVMAGPLARDALVQPHAIDVREHWFRDAAFCGRCHQDTFAEWDASEAQPAATCQECHMPVVRRKVTQATDMLSSALVAFETELDLRAHTFDVSGATVESRRFLPDGFLTLTVTPLDGSVRVALRNHLPHALPTGGFGAHTVEVRAVVVTAPGGEKTVHRASLRSKRQGALASGGELLFEIPVQVGDAPDARVLVEVERLTAAGAAPERLATFDVTEALEAGPGRAIDREVRLAQQAEAPRSGHGE